MTTVPEFQLLGRRSLLKTIEQLLVCRRSVLLVGPADIGKSALIQSLSLNDVMVIDPFERISAHRAARIRRAMDRGLAVIGAARNLHRASLGRVGRIIWRFTTVRVPRLPGASMRRLVQNACALERIPANLITSDWLRAVTNVAQGRPGVGLIIVQHAAAIREGTRLPAAATAYLQAEFQRASKDRVPRTELGVDR